MHLIASGGDEGIDSGVGSVVPPNGDLLLGRNLPRRFNS
jgi:hypothetical protein